ncbi:sugar ABC transporter ATP-binding protein [Reticulibacter mediterranei]|uniref:Sugar ABC transporter ATP-binding protein n=1 Tax=Reticulibacter mediterranei TaxID=2778369 RepID=A0A8J3IDP2_9CHLR|nr:carbohydrate ABC transporter permease [Reticulibacter mediterranei]GHO90658.1 sugar ABC transporter ATP-binding protein [Reticulibacter mediterranei]
MAMPLLQRRQRSTPPYWNMHRRKRATWTAVSVVLWMIAILFILPFVWMLVSSLKREIDVFSLPVRWIPDPLVWQNYLTVWTGVHPLTLYVGNSIIVAVCRVLGELFTASLAAYGFARLRFPGRNALFLVYLSTLIIPAQLLLVPRFILFQELGIYDTLLALILPGIFTALGTFLLRQFFLTIPQELSDAARIDGANDWQIYWRIILPLAKPALASLAILAFVWSWNDYETPLVMLTSEHNFTIPLGLTNYMDDSGGFSASLIMAGAVSSVLPVIAFFLVMQRQFIQALARSGLKG